MHCFRPSRNDTSATGQIRRGIASVHEALLKLSAPRSQQRVLGGAAG